MGSTVHRFLLPVWVWGLMMMALFHLVMIGLLHVKIISTDPLKYMLFKMLMWIIRGSLKEIYLFLQLG